MQSWGQGRKGHFRVPLRSWRRKLDDSILLNRWGLPLIGVQVSLLPAQDNDTFLRDRQVLLDGSNGGALILSEVTGAPVT